MTSSCCLFLLSCCSATVNILAFHPTDQGSIQSCEVRACAGHLDLLTFRSYALFWHCSIACLHFTYWLVGPPNFCWQHKGWIGTCPTTWMYCLFNNKLCSALCSNCTPDPNSAFWFSMLNCGDKMQIVCCLWFNIRFDYWKADADPNTA